MTVPQPVVAVFGASSAVAGDAAYEHGVRCGRLLAEADLTVATGGYGGIMEAVSQGAAEAGGHVIGVTAPAVFPSRSGANGYVGEERPADGLTQRIADLIDPAVAVIALPGSLGTATELLVAWNLAYVAKFSDGEAPRILTVGTRWRRLVDTLAAELDTDRSLVTSVESVDEAVAEVVEALTP
jgi:uncharacterized protein (TIGR00730 family)